MKRFITHERNVLHTVLLSGALLCGAALGLQSANAATLHTDDFESGLGNWSNSTSGDNKNWSLDSNGTPSSGTGPSTGAGASSYYVYLETSSGSAFSAGDTAALLSPLINSSDISLSFAFHMYGSDIGTLALDVLTPSGWTNDVWSVSGQQHSSNSAAYTNANVNLNSYQVSQLRFRATAAGSYRGDIAIDNVVIDSTPTGPVAPVFSSAELSKPIAREGQAYATSIAADSSDANGDAISFSKSSGPAWLTVSPDGSLTGAPSSSDIGDNSFVVAASDGSLSSTATLSIKVVDRFTPIVFAEDDFEQGLGNWSNTITDDNKNWTRRAGTTPSSGTGPNSGSNSNNYLYLETSAGEANSAGDSAILLSPQISGSSITLGFDYHMYGSNIGTLAVDVLSNGNWINDVWSLAGQQQTSNAQAYESAIVDLANYQVSQIRFRATANGGYRGDIAIDNIELKNAPETAPTAPQFTSDSFTLSDARENLIYNGSIADEATDANGDVLNFSKVSGPVWLSVDSDGALSGLPNASNIGINTFVVNVSDGVLNDTATLTIEVTANVNNQPISFADFETVLGDWLNVSHDSYDWIRQGGSTTTTNTGPSEAADGSNFYLYVETSSGGANNAGDSVILESKPIIGGSGIHIKFKYHMWGRDIGSLSIDVFDGTAWIEDVSVITGTQQFSSRASFGSHDADLSLWHVEKIRLRVTAAGGDKGDIAIDSLEITGNGVIDQGPPPPPVKIAFVTSQSYNGDLGGLSGADSKCQTEASNAGLSGTFKAFLSDNNTTAASRLNQATVPYETVTGVRIAADWIDLTDRIIDNPLNVTAIGTTVSGFAWTGSDYDGTKATYFASDYPPNYGLDLTCSSWTSGNPGFRTLGARGNINDPRAWADWWMGDGSSCTSQLGLYCLEQ